MIAWNRTTTSNQARSLDPAFISGQWQRWWIYRVGPATGAISACLVCSFLAKRIEVVKSYHFDSDPRRTFPQDEQTSVPSFNASQKSQLINPSPSDWARR